MMAFARTTPWKQLSIIILDDYPNLNSPTDSADETVFKRSQKELASRWRKPKLVANEYGVEEVLPNRISLKKQIPIIMSYETNWGFLAD